MAYDPETHHRRSTRLRGYDYARVGACFVTLCAQERLCLFGEIASGEMYLNALGHIVEEEWLRSAEIRTEILLDAFVVMPNHLHGIVVIVPPNADSMQDHIDPRGYTARLVDGAAHAGTHDPLTAPSPDAGATGTGRASSPTLDVGATGRSPLRGAPPPLQKPGPRPKSLGAMMAGFRSAATSRINALRGAPGAKVWQRNYHDRIIRNEREWRATRQYIEQNPARWGDDRNNPERL